MFKPYDFTRLVKIAKNSSGRDLDGNTISKRTQQSCNSMQFSPLFSANNLHVYIFMTRREGRLEVSLGGLRGLACAELHPSYPGPTWVQQHNGLTSNMPPQWGLEGSTRGKLVRREQEDGIRNGCAHVRFLVLRVLSHYPNSPKPQKTKSPDPKITPPQPSPNRNLIPAIAKPQNH